MFLALFLFTNPISKLAFPDEAQARIGLPLGMIVALSKVYGTPLTRRTAARCRQPVPRSLSKETHFPASNA